MFTDRFIKIPVKIYSEKSESLTGKSENWDAEMKLNPMEISSYYNSFDDENSEAEIVDITFKNGTKTAAHMSMKEFEKLLNDFT